MVLRFISNPGNARADLAAAWDYAPSPSRWSTGKSVFADRASLDLSADILVGERAAARESIRHSHDRPRRNARSSHAIRFADHVDAIRTVARQRRAERVGGVRIGGTERRLLGLQVDQAHHAMRRPSVHVIGGAGNAAG